MKIETLKVHQSRVLLHLSLLVHQPACVSDQIVTSDRHVWGSVSLNSAFKSLWCNVDFTKCQTWAELQTESFAVPVEEDHKQRSGTEEGLGIGSKNQVTEEVLKFIEDSHWDGSWKEDVMPPFHCCLQDAGCWKCF